MIDDIAQAFGLARIGSTDTSTGYDQLSVEPQDEPDAWRQHAACHPRHRPDDMTPAEWTGQFFPHRGETPREARAICGSCPVVDDCLADGLMDRVGIRGGLSERQRRTVRKSRAA